MYQDAFFTLYTDLPRQGPGGDEATMEALRRLPALPPDPRVLDLGCGSGRQTLVLARELDTPVTAVDLHQPYLDQLQAEAVAAKVSHLITAQQGDMATLDDRPGSVDLIWSEGAIYILGFGHGLELWRGLLREGGLMVVSELTWLTDDPPAGAREFWSRGYPPMTGIEGNLRTAETAGYEVLDRFALPQRCWWDEYYAPLAERVIRLRPQSEADPDLARVLGEAQEEMDVCRMYGESYSYVFYIMCKN